MFGVLINLDTVSFSFEGQGHQSTSQGHRGNVPNIMGANLLKGISSGV